MPKSKNYRFKVEAPFAPSGDQPRAIAKLCGSIDSGNKHQVLLGVTGSGKTYTIAKVVEQLQRPALVMAHNKTLAAQLYNEFKSFFPHNAIEYFVSYYDYFQPEAYVPASDTYIEKDALVNEQIEQLRLSATKSLMERNDVLIVATVSAIYGLGSPSSYAKMSLQLQRGASMGQRRLIRHLTEIQYQRNDANFARASYRVRGDLIDIFPAENDDVALRVELFDDTVERLSLFDPLLGSVLREVESFTLYPRTHYVTPREMTLSAIDTIRAELKQRLDDLRTQHRLLEVQRLEERTRYDLEMMQELGYCNGIENYSRHLTGFSAGSPPPTLYDYLPDDILLVIDESHVTIPQLGAMYKGDRSRKENLVNYGFRLPSALDNRPLRFDEWEQRAPQTIFISATPADYEKQRSQLTTELLLRPTGIIDPQIEIKPAANQVDDLLEQIRQQVSNNQRVLVTVLTKRMAEDLSEYLSDNGIKVRYLHSDIDAVERVEILRNLRMGSFDVLVGINLLREGLDLPEVALVAILDADKEGFLRSERSLIQTIGRAARNVSGKAILYADHITDSMQKAIDETDRRRQYQHNWNQQHGITPKQIEREVISGISDTPGNTSRGRKRNSKVADDGSNYRINYTGIAIEQGWKTLKRMEADMQQAASKLEFEKAANIRDQIRELRSSLLEAG